MSRVNGFRRPFHPLQILSWILFGFLCLIFNVLLLPPFSKYADTSTMYGLGAIEWLLAVLSTVFTVQTTRCNPLDRLCEQNHSTGQISNKADIPIEQADDHARGKAGSDNVIVKRRRGQRQRRNVGNGESDADLNDTIIYCQYCKHYVYLSSKHCRLCDKCIHVYDHHCKWLNNCVGAANYSSFLCTVGAVGALLSFHCVCAAILLAFTFSTNETVWLNALSSIYSDFFATSSSFTAFLFVFLCIHFPLLALDVHLLTLHAYLIYNDFTTYEWIMRSRNNENEMHIQTDIDTHTKMHEVESLPFGLPSKRSAPLSIKRLPNTVESNQNTHFHTATATRTAAVEAIDEKRPKRSLVSAAAAPPSPVVAHILVSAVNSSRVVDKDVAPLASVVSTDLQHSFARSDAFPTDFMEQKRVESFQPAVAAAPELQQLNEQQREAEQLQHTHSWENTYRKRPTVPINSTHSPLQLSRPLALAEERTETLMPLPGSVNHSQTEGPNQHTTVSNMRSSFPSTYNCSPTVHLPPLNASREEAQLPHLHSSAVNSVNASVSAAILSANRRTDFY